MILASIDIGTNTVLLLVAEVFNDKIIPIRDEYHIPRIGKDLISNKLISDESCLILIDVLREYILICSELKVDKILIVGTAPFRLAKNSNEIIEKIDSELKLKIRILSETEEAILTFLGGISNFSEYFGYKDFLVIDVGGGSTELTIGNLENIYFRKSFEIGAVILKDLFFTNFPYQNDLRSIYSHLETIINPPSIEKRNLLTIAVAGTPTTLASIYKKQTVFNEPLIDKTLLKNEYLTNLINEFYKLTPEQIKSYYPAVVNGREDVILSGTIILKFILDILNIKEFYVSTRGVRYGIIIKYLIENHTSGFWTKVGLKKFISS